MINNGRRKEREMDDRYGYNYHIDSCSCNFVYV